MITEQDYQDYLDDIYDLTMLGWQGLPFSILFKKGDPIAYQLGYEEWEAEQEQEED